MRQQPQLRFRIGQRLGELLQVTSPARQEQRKNADAHARADRFCDRQDTVHQESRRDRRVVPFAPENALVLRECFVGGDPRTRREITMMVTASAEYRDADGAEPLTDNVAGGRGRGAQRDVRVALRD